MSVKTEREVWLDALRGFTMILVVVGHVARGLFASGAIPDPIYPHLDRALYSLHLPLLFVLSGYGFHGSIARRSFGSTWGPRLRQLIHPYFVWTFITATLMFMLSKVVNQPLSLVEYLWLLARSPVEPYSIFWFFYALAMAKVALSLLVERGGLGPLGLLAVGLLGLVGNQILMSAYGPIEVFQTTTFLKIYFFFAMGYALAARPSVLNGATVAVTGVLAVAAWLVIILTEQGIDGPFGLATGVIGCLFAFSAAHRGESLAPRKLYNLQAFIGAWSLDIFVMHILFNGAARVALNKAGIESLGLHLVIGGLTGTFGPIVAGYVLRRLKVGRILGL